MVWQQSSLKSKSFYSQSGRGTRNAKKPLKGFQGCDKNGLNESFKMSPHLICLSWHFNFHITSRPDPEAGHKRDLGCQPRPIKWGLISQLSFRAFSWHPWKQLRGFFQCISSSFWYLTKMGLSVAFFAEERGGWHHTQQNTTRKMYPPSSLFALLAWQAESETTKGAEQWAMFTQKAKPKSGCLGHYDGSK